MNYQELIVVCPVLFSVLFDRGLSRIIRAYYSHRRVTVDCFTKKLTLAPHRNSNDSSSQRRLGPSPSNITSNQCCAYVLAGQNLIGTICLIRFCSGLDSSLRWNDGCLSRANRGDLTGQGESLRKTIDSVPISNLFAEKIRPGAAPGSVANPHAATIVSMRCTMSPRPSFARSRAAAA